MNAFVATLATKHCLHCWSVERGINPGPNMCNKDAIAAATREALEETEKILQRHNKINHSGEQCPPRCARHIATAIAALHK